MPNWFIIENDAIINTIVADSKEVLESLPINEYQEDDGIKAIGWTRLSGIWQAPYPTDGLDYIWDDKLNCWKLKAPTIPEDTFIIEG
jgi:hypothetical protein